MTLKSNQNTEHFLKKQELNLYLFFDHNFDHNIFLDHNSDLYYFDHNFEELRIKNYRKRG